MFAQTFAFAKAPCTCKGPLHLQGALANTRPLQAFAKDPCIYKRPLHLHRLLAFARAPYICKGWTYTEIYVCVVVCSWVLTTLAATPVYGYLLQDSTCEHVFLEWWATRQTHNKFEIAQTQKLPQVFQSELIQGAFDGSTLERLFWVIAGEGEKELVSSTSMEVCRVCWSWEH